MSKASDQALAQAEIVRLEHEIEDLRARQALPAVAHLIAKRLERIEQLRGQVAEPEAA